MKPPSGWSLGKMLAVGGTAIVYELLGNQPAVVKWARWRDRDIRARFVVEAEVLRTVGPPATPALIDHGTVEDWPYILMEHVTGETLAAWMSRTGERGGLGEIIAILTRIASSLGALHDAGYVHRDLKPENVIIGARGARLLDFGLAKPVRTNTAGLTQVGTVVGTPHYIAPEQIRMGGVVDQRADIYSLGVIAFEMLAGRPPFVGERRAIEYQHQVGRPPSVRETRQIPEALDELVLRCLSKQPEARPQSTVELRDLLGKALTSAGTIRGVGGVTPSSPMVPLGHQSEVALAWIVGGDLVSITRAITDVQGIVVRQRGDGILAAFSATQHEAPMAVALAACRGLLPERCRVVLHSSSALVRRSAHGKPTVYGKDLERVAAWTPSAPFVGLVLTQLAAERSNAGAIPATDVPGFFRERDTASGNTTDFETEPTLVGRTSLVDQIANAIVMTPILVNISGPPGSGKSRVLAAIANKLRTSSREIVHVHARRHFLGDRADGHRLVQALGGGTDADPFVSAALRRVILLVDDLDRLSTPAIERVVRTMPLARIVTSTRPLFEVAPGDSDRIAVELPKLSHADAGVLLREQLRPARLIPDVLIERLALRGLGNPRLLLALARDVKHRGAIRRHAGSDEWYVAADELDTLLAPPGPSWLAVRALDDVPPEVAPVLRMCSGLGARFAADEVAHVTHISDSTERLAYLLRAHLLVERAGWYEFEDAALQSAIYDHLLDERELVHQRALEYWLDHPSGNRIGRLARIAYHAAGTRERETAVAGYIALANAARRRGEHDQSEILLDRAAATLSIAPVVRELCTSHDDE